MHRVLARLRARYGPIFLMKTGPVKQIWIGDLETLRRVYDLPECSGRPASFADPFGNFLFLTKKPEDAEPIRKAQRAWLVENLRSSVVAFAVEDAVTLQILPKLGSGGIIEWPEEAVRKSMYRAITATILGETSLASDEELQRLMAATKKYSEMRRKAKFGQSGAGSKEPPPGAAEIRDIVITSLERSGRNDAEAALPLLVAASVGGAEIFPTLLHWICLYFARHPDRQNAAAILADRRDSAGLMTEIYGALRRTAYSVALGPPRKVLADVEFDGFQIPEGSLLFAMHPAVADEELPRTAQAADENFRSYAFGVGGRSCLGQDLAEALLPAAVGTLLRSYHLSVPPGPDGSAALKAAGEMKGQLMRPAGSPKLLWRKRTET